MRLKAKTKQDTDEHYNRRIARCINKALANEYQYWGPLQDTALAIIVKSETGLQISPIAVGKIRESLGFQPATIRAFETVYLKSPTKPTKKKITSRITDYKMAQKYAIYTKAFAEQDKVEPLSDMRMAKLISHEGTPVTDQQLHVWRRNNAIENYYERRRLLNDAIRTQKNREAGC